MNRYAAAFSASIFACMAPAAAQQAASRGPVEVETVFRGPAQLRGGGAADVLIQNWSIRGHQRIAGLRLPFQGLMIVELRAGGVATVIEGRRVDRHEGEIWSVPEGRPMQLETEDDTAVLQTTLVGG